MILAKQMRHEALECAKLVKFGAPVESVRHLIAISEAENIPYGGRFPLIRRTALFGSEPRF